MLILERKKIQTPADERVRLSPPFTLSPALPPPPPPPPAMMEADQDGDGKLSFEEFKDMVASTDIAKQMVRAGRRAI